MRWIALALFALTACAAPTPPADAEFQAAEISDGHELAVNQCGQCHAVDTTGVSPRPDAPPFRIILSRYNAATLEEELITGVKVGHPDMPNFQISPQAVDSLILYLQSIQTAPPPR